MDVEKQRQHETRNRTDGIVQLAAGYTFKEHICSV